MDKKTCLVTGIGNTRKNNVGSGQRKKGQFSKASSDVLSAPQQLKSKNTKL